MTASLANFWTLWSAPSATGPKPPRRHAPVLMADILVSRGQEPEFLIRWREDRDGADRD